MDVYVSSPIGDSGDAQDSYKKSIEAFQELDSQHGIIRHATNLGRDMYTVQKKRGYTKEASAMSRYMVSQWNTMVEQATNWYQYKRIHLETGCWLLEYCCCM